jgi:hypothetical protein
MLKEIAGEIVGMFAGDARLAAAILAIVAIAAVLIDIAKLDPVLGGLALLGGCLVLLVESVRRAARRPA